MTLQRISREEYLDENFDYTKLTKQELRQIMSENEVKNIPNLTALKSVIIDAYKFYIHDRIPELKGNFSEENIFQKEQKKRNSSDLQKTINSSEYQNSGDLQKKTNSSDYQNSGDSIEEKEEIIISNPKGIKDIVKEESKKRKSASTQNTSIDKSEMGSTSMDKKGSDKKGSTSIEKNGKGYTNVDKSGNTSGHTTSIEKNGKGYTNVDKSGNTSGHTTSIEKNDSFNQINSSLINRSFNSEDPNSTLGSKAKMPFIAIPRKVNISKENRKTRTLSFFRIFSVFLSLFLIYLKFFCPYCKNGLKICIPVPPHTKLVHDKLVVDEGYRLVKSIVDFTIPDNHAEGEVLKKVNDFVKLLEVLKGDYKYGFTKSPKIKAETILDVKVLDGILKTGKVLLKNGTLEARRARVTPKSFFKFYFYFFCKISLIFSFLIILIKMFWRVRKERNSQRQKAVCVAKEVLTILNQQILMSLKTPQYRPQVLSIQLRDGLEISKDVWKFVEEIIEKNSNVEKSRDLNGHVVWQWIGPVLYKNNEISEIN